MTGNKETPPLSLRGIPRGGMTKQSRLENKIAFPSLRSWSQRQTSGQGFTLVELLVVLAIFGTAMVVIADIFIRINDTSRRVEFGNRIQGELRFAIERVTEAVRTGRIDYGAYGGTIPAGGGQALHLLDADGAALSFTLETNQLCPASSPQCLVMTSNGRSASLTPNGVEVEQVLFFVSPATDPFARDARGQFLSDEEPRVTIALRLAGAGTHLTVQTTISSRYYAR